MDSKKLKFIIHEIARILIILSIVVFVVPTIAQIFNMIFPSSADPSGVAAITSIKEFLLSLCFLYAGLSLIPAGTIILFALTAVIGIFDLVWRTIRGHKLRVGRVIMLVLALGMPIFLFVTNFTL